MAWGNVPIGEIRERQGRKLHQFVANKVYPFCPHYRRVLDEAGLNPDSLRTLEDLQKLPFTYKKDIASTEENPARFRDFIIQPDEAKLKQSLGLFDKIGLVTRAKREGKSIKDIVLDEYLPALVDAVEGGEPTVADATRRLMGAGVMPATAPAVVWRAMWKRLVTCDLLSPLTSSTRIRLSVPAALEGAA